jgi:hypothetical protein
MQDVLFKPSSLDGTVEGTALQRWNDNLIAGAAKTGRDWHCTKRYREWFEEVGFEEVVEKQFYWPGNTWPKGKKQKEMGLCMLTNGLEGLNAVSMAMLTRAYGMTAAEVEDSLVDVRADMKNKAIHAYYPV